RSASWPHVAGGTCRTTRTPRVPSLRRSWSGRRLRRPTTSATPDRTAKSQPPGSLPDGCTLPTSGSTRPARSAGRRPLTQVAGVRGEAVRDDAVAKLLRRLVPEGPRDRALDARARDEVERDALEVDGAVIQAGRVVVHLLLSLLS